MPAGYDRNEWLTAESEDSRRDSPATSRRFAGCCWSSMISIIASRTSSISGWGHGPGGRSRGEIHAVELCGREDLNLHGLSPGQHRVHPVSARTRDSLALARSGVPKSVTNREEGLPPAHVVTGGGSPSRSSKFRRGRRRSAPSVVGRPRTSSPRRTLRSARATVQWWTRSGSAGRSQARFRWPAPESGSSAARALNRQIPHVSVESRCQRIGGLIGDSRSRCC